MEIKTAVRMEIKTAGAEPPRPKQVRTAVRMEIKAPAAASYILPKTLSIMISILDFVKMNERQFLEFAEQTPVFTTKQVAAALGDQAYSWVFLNRMVERDLIRRLRRGYYTVQEDPVIYASHIFHPSYISLWYAFQHYGATTQLPARIEVMARKAEVMEKVELVRTREMWGYGQINYSGHRIFMADLEKAIIDAIETGRVPADEIMNAVVKADPEKLEEYALRMPITSMRKIGYVAEMAGQPFEALFNKVKDDRNYARYYAAEKGNRWRVRK